MASLVVNLPDDSILAKAAEVASQKNTSVEEMVRRFLTSLGSDDIESPDLQGRPNVRRLQESFEMLSRPLGGKGYVNRDELYER